MKENVNSKNFVKLPNLKVSITVIVHQGIWYLCILIIFQILVILNILILKNITQIPSIHYIKKSKKFVINNCQKDGNIKLKQITNLNKNGPKKYKNSVYTFMFKKIKIVMMLNLRFVKDDAPLPYKPEKLVILKKK